MSKPAAEQAPQKADLRRHYRALRQTLLPQAGPAIADQLQAAWACSLRLISISACIGPWQAKWTCSS